MPKLESQPLPSGSSDPLVNILVEMIKSALQWEAERRDGDNHPDSGLTGVVPSVDYSPLIPRLLSPLLGEKDDDE